MNKEWIYNPKLKGSGVISCIPQTGECPVKCDDCFFQSGRSYLEPHEENLPHIPSQELAEGRIVRMNDGNDSNNQRELVEETAQQFKDYFFNTSIPKDLETFSGPVVLTVNPSTMTDKNFHKLDPIPRNLMFVRVRVNTWNLLLLDEVVKYYTPTVPVMITYMAYYQEKLPKGNEQYYEWKKRTTNSYWVITKAAMNMIEGAYDDNLKVFCCGADGLRGLFSCPSCGNCVREYYNTKERLRDAQWKH